MPRPQKQTADYFPHFAGASDGRSMFILQSRFGNDGYACWFKLLEILASSEGHSFDYSKPADWQFLLAKMGVSADRLLEILGALSDLDAIDPHLYQCKILWVQKFIDNLGDLYKRRKVDSPRKPGVSADINPVSADINPVSADIYPHSIGEERRGEDSRGDGIAASEISDNGSESLYKLLEGTEGFPAYSLERFAKLEDVMRDYPGLNYRLEFKKFREYWNTRQLKRPWLALRNWLGRVKEANSGKARHSRDFPAPYSAPPEYADD